MTYSINTPDGKTITKNSKVNYTHAIIANGFKQGAADESRGYWVISAHKTRAAAEASRTAFENLATKNNCVGYKNLTLVEVN